MDLATLCPITVPDALARTVALAPDGEAIVAPDGRATVAELGAQVAEVRRALLTGGIGKGDRVGICLGNSRGWVVLFLALGSIGALTGSSGEASDGRAIASPGAHG